MLPEPIAVTLKVTQVLEKLNIPYLISGSLASTLYGMVRTTQDSDIVAEMRPEHIGPFTASLEAEFFIDEATIGAAIRDNSSFNIIHRESMFKVDTFVPQLRPFLRSQMARAQREVLSTEPEASARFASAEDTILSKLEWYRLGNEVSERQWRDVLGILRSRAGGLDLEYLQEWGRDLKVSDLLDRALAQANIPNL